MKKRISIAVTLAALCLLWALPSSALVMCKKRSGVVAFRDICKTTETVLDSAEVLEALDCPPDSVRVGSACVDKYEGSVWSTTNSVLIEQIKSGAIASAGELIGATQYGTGSDDYGAGCPDTAANCVDYYAVSIPGVVPSASITWFQAQAACRNAGKRLATNAEWQAAAYGTPDPGTDNGTTDCNVGNTFATANAGSRSSCVSDVGAFDMVGNLAEWVGDWGDQANNGCADWTSQTGIPGGDFSCFGGDGIAALWQIPGALLRGGYWNDGPSAGVFTVFSVGDPTDSVNGVGFRCAR